MNKSFTGGYRRGSVTGAVTPDEKDVLRRLALALVPHDVRTHLDVERRCGARPGPRLPACPLEREALAAHVEARTTMLGVRMLALPHAFD